MAAQRVMRRVRLAGMDFIYHFVRFELSCRTGPLRVARSLRDLYTFSWACRLWSSRWSEGGMAFR